VRIVAQSWAQRARCASDEPGVDRRDFQVPLRGNSQNKAKLICAGCPVQVECLRWSLEHNELWGVWGGLDEAEIRRTLSVNALGKYVHRCRPPGCPNPKCRARPSMLEILQDGRVARVRCTVCTFEWASPTSVAAIRTYQRERAQVERRRLRLKTRAALVLVATQTEHEPQRSSPRSTARESYALVASVLPS
jgi:hypothetical protein